MSNNRDNPLTLIQIGIEKDEQVGIARMFGSSCYSFYLLILIWIQTELLVVILN